MRRRSQCSIDTKMSCDEGTILRPPWSMQLNTELGRFAGKEPHEIAERISAQLKELLTVG